MARHPSNPPGTVLQENTGVRRGSLPPSILQFIPGVWQEKPASPSFWKRGEVALLSEATSAAFRMLGEQGSGWCREALGPSNPEHPAPALPPAPPPAPTSPQKELYSSSNIGCRAVYFRNGAMRQISCRKQFARGATSSASNIGARSSVLP